jgi:hypothetical protein
MTRVAEDLVSFTNSTEIQLELGHFRLFISQRMVLECQLAVGLSDVFFLGIRLNLKSVIILVACHFKLFIIINQASHQRWLFLDIYLNSNDSSASEPTWFTMRFRLCFEEEARILNTFASFGGVISLFLLECQDLSGGLIASLAVFCLIFCSLGYRSMTIIRYD